MTDARIPLRDCPDLPLYLSKPEAARYVGVSTNLFEQEMRNGLWPAPESRDEKGGRLTWYRPAIEAAAAARNDSGGEDDPWAKWDRENTGQNRPQKAIRRKRGRLSVSP